MGQRLPYSVTQAIDSFLAQRDMRMPVRLKRMREGVRTIATDMTFDDVTLEHLLAEELTRRGVSVDYGTSEEATITRDERRMNLRHSRRLSSDID